MMVVRMIQWLSRVAYKAANLAGNVLLGCTFLILLAGVVFRYVFHYPLAWPEETSMIFLVWMVFFGASMGLKERSHVGIMAFLFLFPARVRDAVSIIVDCLVGFFAAYLMVFGWKISVFAGSTQSTIYWGVPYFYLYLSVAVGGFLLLIQACALIMEDIQNVLSSQKE
jgi:TRAP-type C4-dicarboxylate transport system permease small subunit